MKKRLLFVLQLAVCISVEAKQLDEQNETERNSQEAYDGFYVGAGAVSSTIKADATNVSHSYEAHGMTPMNFNHALNYDVGNYNLLGEFHESCICEVVNAELNGGLLTGFKVGGAVNKKQIGSSASKFGGSCCFGFGKFVYRAIYLGSDFTLDFVKGGNKKGNDESSFDGEQRIEIKGSKFIPTLSIRCGAYCEPIGALIFLKVGASGIRTDVELSGKSVKYSQFVPVVGIGAEKSVGFLSLRLDVDYRALTSKNKELSRNVYYDQFGAHMRDVHPVVLNERIESRLKTKGYAVRVMAIAHI